MSNHIPRRATTRYRTPIDRAITTGMMPFVRAAIQTISWGPRYSDIEGMLRKIREIGYEGVELAQPPGVLGPMSRLYRLVSELGLKVIGFSGGTLAEKQELATQYENAERAEYAKWGSLALWREYIASNPAWSKPYIYMDGWTGGAQVVLNEQRHRLALHPHMFKPVQSAAETEEYLEKYPNLYFLPDTGHLTIAGEDPVKVIERNLARVAAVHLTDWTPDWGRSYPFYSRGFTELGKGIVPLIAVINTLKKNQYEGWLVVKQDSSDSPLKSSEISLNWLIEYAF